MPKEVGRTGSRSERVDPFGDLLAELRDLAFRDAGQQRRYRLASDTLIYDLQFRLRCKGCNRRSGFRITIFDNCTRGDSSKPRLERMVMAGDGKRRRGGVVGTFEI